MESLVTLIGLAIGVFVSTNIDDVFVLVAFFADKNLGVADVVIGQYAGTSILFMASVIGALISLIIPPAYVGLLGLVPIVIGARRLYGLRRDQNKEEVAGRTNGNERKDRQSVSDARAHSRKLTVALVTMANGGDNIAIYTAFLATRNGYEVSAIGILFAVMTGLWCFAAHWLVKHRAFGAPIRDHARRVVPFVLIGLGVLILGRTGMLSALSHLTTYRN
jgi:cadmium resistance protein CadD (predicted permease)